MNYRNRSGKKLQIPTNLRTKQSNFAFIIIIIVIYLRSNALVDFESWEILNT